MTSLTYPVLNYELFEGSTLLICEQSACWDKLLCSAPTPNVIKRLKNNGWVYKHTHSLTVIDSWWTITHSSTCLAPQMQDWWWHADTNLSVRWSTFLLTCLWSRDRAGMLNSDTWWIRFLFLCRIRLEGPVFMWRGRGQKQKQKCFVFFFPLTSWEEARTPSWEQKKQNKKKHVFFTRTAADGEKSGRDLSQCGFVFTSLRYHRRAESRL